MRRYSLHISQRGSVQAFGLIFAVSMVFLVLGLAQFQKVHTTQNNYIFQMDRALQVAEMGMNSALGKVSREPEVAIQEAALVVGGLHHHWETVSPKESYGLEIYLRNNPEPGIYYIVSTGSRTVGGKPYIMKLHSYVRISNVGDYFAAVNDELTIAHGTDLSNARVYALNLFFQRKNSFTYDMGVLPPKTIPGDNQDSQTVVLAANFSEHSGPNVGNCVGADCEWLPDVGDQLTNANPPGIQEDIRVLNGAAPHFAPTKLAAPLLLPQVLSSDMAYYQSLAGPHVNPSMTPNPANTFTGHIFPPGYINGGSPDVLDTYDGHTELNAQHVYYFDSDVYVQGQVHGQVIIVSNSHIHITGDVFSSPSNISLPGGGEDPDPNVYASSSTAHQLVLIPGPNKNVYIENTVWGAGGTMLNPKVVRIEGLIMTPNGGIISNVTSNQNMMKLHFVGSMILGRKLEIAGSFTNNSANPFTMARRYEYMQSLRDNPPPYLPGLTEVYHSLSEVVTGADLY